MKNKQDILEIINKYSPYLTKLIEKQPDFFDDIYTKGFEALYEETIDFLSNTEFTTKENWMKSLRIAKQKIALLTAVADISEKWTVEKVTTVLSQFANLCINKTIDYLVEKSEELNNKDGIIILALGKLGADELNYSSDIDLMLFFEIDKISYSGKNIQSFFTKFTQRLAHILQELTKDGYVFRVDLRLRPDPASTPPMVSVARAINYYNTVGQNWERAALIKANPIAGDIKAGGRFLDKLRPYIWRTHLDFESIKDIHSIKRQMDIKLGNKKIALAGHNIKVGIGGIREIEFYAQTQQLIWGGRKLKLRERTTCSALQALTDDGRIKQEITENLIKHYRFLRTLEHRLQMINDQQTHTIPVDKEEILRVANFMGYETLQEFEKEYEKHLVSVHKYYTELFEEDKSLAVIEGRLVFTGVENDPETIKTLNVMGFKNAEKVSEIVRSWHHGKREATKTTKSRELLTELMPSLLKALANTANPDYAFLNFDGFIAKINVGVQFFSSLYSNPKLLYLIADIMGSTPHLGEMLGKYPHLLDGILLRESSPMDKESLRRELNEWLETAVL